MIRPALQLTIEQPHALRFTVQPGNVQPLAILDNGRPVAWATSEGLANQIAGFLNWRDALDASERRYAEILHA